MHSDWSGGVGMVCDSWSHHWVRSGMGWEERSGVGSEGPDRGQLPALQGRRVHYHGVVHRTHPDGSSVRYHLWNSPFPGAAPQERLHTVVLGAAADGAPNRVHQHLLRVH